MTPTQFAAPAPQAFAAPPAQRRGACPSLAAPMQTGDGLLARLRPIGRALTPDQLERIVTLAAQFGNGQIEITTRGNVQIRGLRPETAEDFAEAIKDVVQIDTGLPIDLSALAGLDPQEKLDPRPLAQAIADGVVTNGVLARLGPKVSLVIDGGGTIALASLTADIRLSATDRGWSLQIKSLTFGPLPAETAVSTALRLLALLAKSGPEARARDLAPSDIATATGLLPAGIAPIAARNTSHWPRALNDTRFAAAIALPFASSAWSTLRDLARQARALDIAEFRLAPGHALIALAPSEETAKAFLRTAAALGFVTNADDPRASINACIGSDGCASGSLPARQIATQLAQMHAAFFDGSFTLHISGCAKGCAHPRKTLLTLVGESDTCHFIVNGTASATPLARFPQTDIDTIMARLTTLWRDNRALGESVAACFKRLGDAALLAALRQG